MSQKTLWDSSQNITVCWKYSDTPSLMNLLNALKTNVEKNVFKNLKILVFVKNGKNLSDLPHNDNVVYVTPRQLNLFGRIKDKELKPVFMRRNDLKLIYGEMPKKFRYVVNKIPSKAIVVNMPTKGWKYDIALKIESKNIDQIVTFIKETLQKISV
jgi:hypothetical protein